MAHYAREAPDTSVEQVQSSAEMRAIASLVFAQQQPSERDREPPADIRMWVVWLEHTAGFQPLKRQVQPGGQRARAGLRVGEKITA